MKVESGRYEPQLTILNYSNQSRLYGISYKEFNLLVNLVLNDLLAES
jgi:hypothetical protein